MNNTKQNTKNAINILNMINKNSYKIFINCTHQPLGKVEPNSFQHLEKVEPNSFQP